MDYSTHPVKLTTVDAEHLESVGYEDLTHTLYLKFHGGPTLRFQKVPRFRYQGLLGAPRKDAYYKTFIKDQFLSNPV
jgi:KTSC domain-containing protein